MDYFRCVIGYPGPHVSNQFAFGRYFIFSYDESEVPDDDGALYHCKFSDLQTEKIVIREMPIFLHQLATTWMSKYKCCMVGIIVT